MNINIKGVTYSYGRGDVLKGLTLDIHDHQFTALLGPNGSGKTTLLKLVSGAMKPDDGKVMIGDQNIYTMDTRTRAKAMSYVQQFFSSTFSYTVFEVAAMGRYPHIARFQGMKPMDIDIINRSLDEAGVIHLKKRSITELSGGELQRVMLARSLAQQSPWMLLDEPVNHLDIRHRTDILNAVRKRVDSGRAALCVLHDVNLASRYADRIVLMKDGEIYKDGTPHEVLTEHNIETLYQVRVKVMHEGNHPTILLQE